MNTPLKPISLIEIEVKFLHYDPKTQQVRLRVTQYVNGNAKRDTKTGNQQNQYILGLGSALSVNTVVSAPTNKTPIDRGEEESDS